MAAIVGRTVENAEIRFAKAAIIIITVHAQIVLETLYASQV